jgi:glycosyltransferase involved in cell wall biosynthesis
MDKIAVLIPCYNECITIKKVVEDFKKALPEATIYVYDNNSKDGTDEIAKKAGAIVRYERKQGKGNVVRTMFREIDAECYIMVDGDDTYPAERAPELVKEVLENNADMVIGDRLSSTYFKENKRSFHNLGNKLVKGLINRLYHSDIRDAMTGYRAFSYRFVKTFPVISKGFEIETEMTIHTLDKNMNFENKIIEYRDRPAGSYSKLKTYSDGFRVIKTILKLKRTYKPISFYNEIALLMFIVGTLFLVPVLVEYFNTGFVPRFPTFIASTFFYIMTVLFFFLGQILGSIVKHNRQKFEVELNAWQYRFNELKNNEK